jgi:AGZA family xanthine/uracil permease-like MFS transporter
MTSYRWAQRGDINAFFGLMLDNVAVMITLVGLISVASAEAAVKVPERIQFTTEFVMTRMIPGTALGVLLGDLVYTWLAFRLARRLGREDVTAMPLGLDTPSTFGVAFLVLLPALQDGYQKFDQDHQKAMEFAWHVGLTVLIFIGVLKTIAAPFGNYVRQLVPRAGLLGSLAAIALALIAFLPMVNAIAAAPLVGMVSLLVILVTLVAHRELPGRFPGALAAVVLGVVLYQLGLAAGRSPLNWPLVPPLRDTSIHFTWQPTALWAFVGHGAEWWSEVLREALAKMPVIFPFALATVVGGIDCTESAAAAGDEYDTRSILLTEGLVSLVAGVLGGVIQTTPYIGHPAYKKMGGRAAYTLATALFIGTAGFLGWFTVLFHFLPEPVMFPILVFVGIEITAVSFHATPVRHYPALALSLVPALAYLITLQIQMVLGPMPPSGPGGHLLVQTLRCLGNGFLITSMLWAAALAMLLDGRLRPAAVYLAVAGLCTLVGIIHSPLPNDLIDLPNKVLLQVPQGFRDAVQYQTPYHWAGAYGLMVVLLLVLDWMGVPETRTGADTSESGKMET